MRYGDFVILPILPKMTITKVTLQVAKQFFFSISKIYSDFSYKSTVESSFGNLKFNFSYFSHPYNPP